MDGATIIAAVAVMQGAFSGITIFATKKIIGTAIKGLTGRIDQEREDRLRVNKDLWKAANTHGHAGLKGNNAKVTR